MTDVFTPDPIGQVQVVTKTSTPVTIFDDSVKVAASGPEFTSLVNFDGAKSILVSQVATKVNPPARAIESSVGVTTPANAIDNDLSTSTGASGWNANTEEMVIDFLSKAVRDVTVKGKITGGTSSGSVTVTMKALFSDGPTGPWSGDLTIATGSVSNPVQSINVTATVRANRNFRYMRLTLTLTGGGVSGNAECFQAFESIGLGTSTLKFQSLNPISATWDDLIPVGEFTTMDSSLSGGTKETVGIGSDTVKVFPLPSSPSSVRAVLTVVDGVDTSVAVTRIF